MECEYIRFVAGMPKGGCRRGAGRKRQRTDPVPFAQRLADWRYTCALTFSSMVACGFCGYVALGNANLRHWTTVRTADLPAALHVAPYAVMNGFMADYIFHSPGVMNTCPLCSKLEACRKRGLHLVHMDPAYVNMNMAFHRFGELVPHSIMDGVLVVSNPTYRPCVREAHLRTLKQLLAYNLDVNPVIQRFKTMMELPVPRTGFPLIPSCAIQDIVGNASTRGPLVDSYPTAEVDSIIAALTNVSPVVPGHLNSRLPQNIGVLHHPHGYNSAAGTAASSPTFKFLFNRGALGALKHCKK